MASRDQKWVFCKLLFHQCFDMHSRNIEIANGQITFIQNDKDMSVVRSRDQNFIHPSVK